MDIPKGHIARLIIPDEIVDKLLESLPAEDDEHIAMVMPVIRGPAVVPTWRKEECSICGQLCWVSPRSELGKRICYDCLEDVWPEWRESIIPSLRKQLNEEQHG